MNIEEVKRWFKMATNEKIEWLISEHDRLTAANATMEKALEWIAEEANTGESGDAYVMKEEALQTLAAVRVTKAAP